MPRRPRVSTKPAPSTAHTALLADLAVVFERHGLALGKAVRLLPELGAPLQQLLVERRQAWVAGQSLQLGWSGRRLSLMRSRWALSTSRKSPEIHREPQRN